MFLFFIRVFVLVYCKMMILFFCLFMVLFELILCFLIKVFFSSLMNMVDLRFGVFIMLIFVELLRFCKVEGKEERNDER